MKSKNTVSIHFELDTNTNSKLTASAKKNGRSKRKEASISLKLFFNLSDEQRTKLLSQELK
ncbi:TraY domain-containing protein [Vibrio cholerae]|uniref:TraY domain-containing protein n=1 Tax=Vibrio cholerae TaxID=666 RepID=UPI0002C16CDF|nr:TraY domain-containing protein [Vibrio cholerae]EMQ61064.1 traY domain protein [Vibrio cholerae O1 str. EM-1727]KPA02667.1 traY domain protein [Vibrio cholerae]